jgi:uncharacterized protein (DUF1778 family)
MAKDALLRFRVTAGEKELIEAAAQRAGLPVSAWLLGVSLKAAAPRPTPQAFETDWTVEASRKEERQKAARAALETAETKAAHLARSAPSKEVPPTRAALCSPHKRLACPRCAPVSPSA